MNWAVISIAVGVLALLVAAYFYQWVKKLPSDERSENIGKLIRHGAFTFLKREYRILAIFVGAVTALILLFFPNPVWLPGEFAVNIKTALAYICGSVLSASAGYVGISIATIANIKSAFAAKKGVAPSFMAGFRGGAVMGMAVVSISLAGNGHRLPAYA